jgi:protein ImuB
MAAASQPDAIYPPWLLPEPLLLEMDGERPCYRGPLSRLIGPQRVETGWWGDKEDGGQPAMRDYYVAESPEAGLVWIFRERPAARFSSGEVRWYLQGFYA